MTPAPRPTAVAALAVLGLLLVAPLAGAGKIVQAPPDATGLGRSDVRDEPDTVADKQEPTNGFPSCGSADGGTSCNQETLVLEAVYESSTAESAVDANNLVRALQAEAGAGDNEDVILPGQGFFYAYWGWWQDRGGHAWAQEATPSLGAPDGRIDDAHDDASAWNDPRHGPWDEFVWRGKNPWAPDHPTSPHANHTDDQMVLFIQPGTHQPREGPPAGLDTGADADDVADAEYKDDTDASPYLQRPVDQTQGWSGAHGYDFTFLDQSLLVATEATTAVNPTPLGGDRYDLSQATAADLDRYAALHSTTTTLYRWTVWDPGDDRDGPVDHVVGGEGLKEQVRGSDPASEAAAAAAEAARSLTYPAAPVQGAADDLAKPPRTHEPNHPRDDYGGNAGHDPNTTYGVFQGASSDYYEPGPHQAYDGYREGDRLWLDVHPGYGTPLYLLAFPFPFNLNVRPGPNMEDPTDPGGSGTAAPGFLYLTAQAGLWWDADGDDWIGRLDDPGRATRPDDPYRSGTVDDPNDYGDTRAAAGDDPDREGVGEWTPLCEGSLRLEGALTPGTPDGSWGDAGVYVIHDPNAGYNPWDDAAADVTGDTPLWKDDDDERLSRHVTEGPIPFDMQWCSKDRGWYGDRFVYMPAGTASYNVTVETTATLVEDQEENVRPDQTLLPAGTSVTDVDILHDWGT